MKKMRSNYKNYVIFTGIFTFLAMGTLFISVLGWLQGGGITLGFSSIIALMIWQFLRNTQPLIPPVTQSKIEPHAELRIPLRKSLERITVNWRVITLVHLGILIFLNLNIFWMAEEVFSKLYLFGNAFYVFLAFTTSLIKTAHLRRALKLIGLRERVLVFSPEGMSIPIELLNEAAMYKALTLKQTEAVLGWTEVERAEVFARMGSQPGQIRFQLTEKHQYADLMGFMALFRTDEVDQHLEVIQTYLMSKVNPKGDL